MLLNQFQLLSNFSMDILKIIAISVISAVVCIVARQIKPEFVPFLQLSSLVVIFTVSIDGLRDLLATVTELIGISEVVYDEYVFLMLKVLGIAVITKIGTEVCNDSGNSALAVGVELIGKAAILMICFPLFRMVINLAGGLLK